MYISESVPAPPRFEDAYWARAASDRVRDRDFELCMRQFADAARARARAYERRALACVRVCTRRTTRAHMHGAPEGRVAIVLMMTCRGSARLIAIERTREESSHFRSTSKKQSSNFDNQSDTAACRDHDKTSVESARALPSASTKCRNKGRSAPQLHNTPAPQDSPRPARRRHRQYPLAGIRECAHAHACRISQKLRRSGPLKGTRADTLHERGPGTTRSGRHTRSRSRQEATNRQECHADARPDWPPCLNPECVDARPRPG